MDRKRPTQSVLVVMIGLALSACATTAPLPSEQASDESRKSTEERRAVTTPAADTAAPEAAKATKDYPDIWARIRAGYAMKPLEGNLVTVHEQWFARNPEYMSRMMERARLYLYHITEEIEKRGLPTELALLPAIESAYQPYAASRAKAVGLWQFIAPTGRLYGLKMNWWYDGRRDVEAATQAALDYLEKLNKEFDGDWHLALAAYNAGEGKINRMMEYNRQRGKPTDYQSLKLKRETINYVPKLQAMANIVADPKKYGVELADIPNTPYFTRVVTGSQVDLGVVAKLTDLPLEDLQVINPAHTRWATDPEGPHHLLVPVHKKDAVEEALANLPEAERVEWRGYEVKRGDSLHDIARKFGVAPETIRSANRLPSNLLRAGQSLVIPVSTRALPPAPPAVASVLAPGRTLPPPSLESKATAPSDKPQPVIHHVRHGETLSSIARRYNVLVQQLAQWNLLDPSDVLKLGQRLRIWPKGGPTALLKDVETVATHAVGG
jgi:membrane-bound lytic murein transglycosylase D